jgi:hypothetical protein
MKVLKWEFTIMVKLIVLCSLVGLMEGCNAFRMTLTDNIRVENYSDHKLHLLVNFDYPDTSLTISTPNTYVDPKDHSTLKLVNRKWEDLFEEKEKVTIFFAEWKPEEFYREGRQGEQKIYGKMILTRAKLDSLGGIITFPLEKE